MVNFKGIPHGRVIYPCCELSGVQSVRVQRVESPKK